MVRAAPILNNGTLTVAYSTFSGNQATGEPGNRQAYGFGGAIFNNVGATLTVTDSTFSANQATGGSGTARPSANTAAPSRTTPAR